MGISEVIHSQIPASVIYSCQKVPTIKSTQTEPPTWPIIQTFELKKDLNQTSMPSFKQSLKRENDSLHS